MYFKKIINSEHGFTITELLVAILISAVVMTGVYSTFYSQHKSYTVQDQVALMQQNLRAAIQCLESEIRMAGCDPKESSGAGIVDFGANTLRITMDFTDDTGTGSADGDVLDTDEDIKYSLNGGDLLKTDKDGTDNVMAENIDALDFVYLNGAGAVSGVTTAIRSVQITLVARTAKPIQGYTDTTSYKNLQGATIYTPGPGDHFRRKCIKTEVLCRNLGY